MASDLWWGTGASAVQVEGASPADNWHEWEVSGRAPSSNSGNGFTARYREDFALLAGWGFTDHRLSLNWARVEPEAGHYDRDAVAYYRDVLAAGREAGLRVWITLLHTAIPRWFADEGGFASPNASQRWMNWVQFAAEEFGDLVGGWMPINNPTSYVNKGYFAGTFPPGVRDHQMGMRVLETLHRCDVEAAVALRTTGLPTASNQSLAPVLPADDSPEAAAAAARYDALIWDSWLGFARDPNYADAFDYVGFSYYYAAAVDGQGRVLPYPAGETVGPLGYVAWPDGLADVLARLDKELPGRRFVVAELGYGGDDDGRTAYLMAALRHIERAREAGIGVDGVFLWTGVDNYEWLNGWDVPFGLFDRDRRPRRSAEMIRPFIHRPAG